MTDRELLEKAAKAAGYEVHIVNSHEQDGTVSFYMKPDLLWWNPLTDDGDALRLAVKLHIQITQTIYGIRADSLTGIDVIEPEADDRQAATRRAIVRAAAAIGEKL